MSGHIQLGAMADTRLRDYALIDIERYQQSNANTFAARVSTGGPYAELDTFNDWTIQDWHSGVGNKDPEAGPLFSMAETRYPGYLMPPPGWVFPAYKHTPANTGSNSASPITLEPLSTKRYAVSFTAPKDGDIDSIWILIHCPSNYETSVSLYDDDGTGKPGSAIDEAGTTSEQTRIHAHWVRHGFNAIALTSSTRYHIVVTTNVAAELSSGIAPYMPTVTLTGGEKCHVSTSGGAWAVEPTSSGATGFRYLMSFSGYNTDWCSGVYTYGGSVFAWLDNAIYKIVSGDFVSKISGITIYDIKQSGQYLYIAYGTGWKRYDVGADVTVDHPAVTTYMFLIYGGYLWRSNGNTVAYSADETTWTTLDDFSNITGNDIKGMAGMGGYVYAATAQGLFQVADGDVVVQVVQWPEVVNSIYIKMVSWENTLYIPLDGGTIMRYSSDGSLINVGINAREELPPDMQGTVANLTATNYFLMAVVKNGDSFKQSSLWSYNVDGWHCLSLAPGGGDEGGGAVCVDRDNDYLYWGMNRALIMRTVFPGDINNPVRSLDDLTLAPEGWVEYDRFYGGHHTLDKDIDRIYIDTEQAGQHVHVYWMDDDNYADYTVGHDGEMGWQYLGTVASGESTIQFPAAARPGGKSFRLALRITTADSTGTTAPVVRGVSVKFSTNVTDRWRWTLPIAVHDNQQFPDGSINPYTAAEMLTHLDSLKDSVAPLQYTDIDGATYYVKVTGASRQVVRYEWNVGDENPDIQWVYVLNLEEMS